MKTAKEVLDALDEFFARDDVPRSEQKWAWDVISALRGPDSDDGRVKARSTLHVRRAALPRTAKQNPFGWGPIFWHTWLSGVGEPRFEQPSELSHFGHHIRDAVMALKIIRGTTF